MEDGQVGPVGLPVPRVVGMLLKRNDEHVVILHQRMVAECVLDRTTMKSTALQIHHAQVNAYD